MEQLAVTMMEVLGELTSYQVFLLGRVDAAHSQRAHLRKEINYVQTLLSSAAAEANKQFAATWSRDDLRDQQRDLAKMVLILRQSEKFYTRCKHEFLEADGPKEVLDSYIEMMAKKRAEV